MITITGTINAETATRVAQELSEIEGKVSVYISSDGGDLMEGLKIYDMFTHRDVDIEVHKAGSVASLIALAGKELPTVQEGGGFAIHNAHTENIEGNHNDLRRIADSLESYSEIVAKIYAKNTKLSTAQALSLMNDSTQIDSHSAIDLGFARNIISSKEVSNSIQLISNLSIIDMNLLQRVKNNLAAIAGEAPPAEAPPEEVKNEGFTPEQLEEITLLVKDVVAEAMAGTAEPMEEAIGNTIAVILNEITSKGTPPQEAQISNHVPAPISGIEAFNKKVAEIKAKNE